MMDKWLTAMMSAYVNFITCPKCKKGKLIPKWIELVCGSCGYQEFIEDERG